jgi:tetratricopeptide (TPR) repeat protein
MLNQYTLEKAHHLHQSGKINDAILIYEDVLKEYPNSSDVTHYLGLAKIQLGEEKAGKHLLEKAVLMEPENVIYRGNYGSALLGLKEFTLAIKHLEMAIKLTPDNYNFHNDLAVAYKELNDFEKAKKHFLQALVLKPEFSLAHKNLGVLYVEKNKAEDALNCFLEALKHSPSDPFMYVNVAKALNILGRHEHAINYLNKALSFGKNIYVIHKNMGYSYIGSQKYDLAEKHFKIGAELIQNSPEPFTDYAELLSLQYRYYEAIECYKKALTIDPKSIIAHVNYGNSLKEIGKYDEAIIHYKHALLLDPNNAHAHHGLGYEYLRKGEYELGWREHEWRFKVTRLKNITGCILYSDKNEWDGTSLKNKVLYIYTEQGIGDVIQFIRFIPEIISVGTKIILACQKELHSLLSCMKEISDIISLDDDPGKYDYQCSLLSLPLKLNVTLKNLNNEVPYIKVENKHISFWKRKMGKKTGKMKVGIVWAGNPAFIKDRTRSPGFEVFEDILNLEEIKFYSLQMGDAKNDLHISDLSNKVIDLTDNLNDFKDTAALMSGLDLIISSCTAPLHLAGSLGLPVWAILSKYSDWRWMVDRSDSPWYPTMRLFRQENANDWQSLMNHIKKELIVFSS